MDLTPSLTLGRPRRRHQGTLQPGRTERSAPGLGDPAGPELLHWGVERLRGSPECWCLLLKGPFQNSPKFKGTPKAEVFHSFKGLISPQKTIWMVEKQEF